MVVREVGSRDHHCLLAEERIVRLPVARGTEDQGMEDQEKAGQVAVGAGAEGWEDVNPAEPGPGMQGGVAVVA